MCICVFVCVCTKETVFKKYKRRKGFISRAATWEVYEPKVVFYLYHRDVCLFSDMTIYFNIWIVFMFIFIHGSKRACVYSIEVYIVHLHAQIICLITCAIFRHFLFCCAAQCIRLSGSVLPWHLLHSLTHCGSYSSFWLTCTSACNSQSRG